MTKVRNHECLNLLCIVHSLTLYILTTIQAPSATSSHAITSLHRSLYCATHVQTVLETVFFVLRIILKMYVKTLMEDPI